MAYHVKELGAVGDGITDDSAAFIEAIRRCEQDGGGTVRVSAGRYLVHPLRLCSHLRLHLEGGATLLLSDDFNVFPIAYTRWAGFMCHALQPGLFADGLENVAITGQGVIDGQGAAWWEYSRQCFRFMQGQGAAPPRYAFQDELTQENRAVDVGGAVWDEWDSGFQS